MIKVKELVYPLNALEPYYNQETLDIHYNILYKGYVSKNKRRICKYKMFRKRFKLFWLRSNLTRIIF